MLKALILVGGYGTRLRPLTLTTPKPLIEFCNKPILFYQIEALVEVGVKRIVLAVSYMSNVLDVEIQKISQTLKVEIILSEEKEPLGTGGPLALAKQYLKIDEDPIFVLNSDVICTFPLDDMLKFHQKHCKSATIAVTKVLEPSKYGVVVTDESSRVISFVEKPTKFISNKINAGIYVLNPPMIDLIEPKPTSIEKDIFPKIVTMNQLYAFDLKGFWMDIGQPKDYLTGMKLYLEHLSSVSNHSLVCAEFAASDSLNGNVIVHPTAIIGKGCHIGPNVVIGPDTVIEDGAFLSNSVVMKGSRIKSYAYINTSIIGTKCTIGCWARLEDITVLGEDVNINDEIYIRGCKILPHKSITTSYFTSEIIM